MACELLDYQGENCHDIYKNILQDSDDEVGAHVKLIRQEITEMWQMFNPYADKNFREEFRRNPDQRYWEMYLGCCLLDRGFTFDKRRDEGPDFSLNVNGHRVWIEAIAPTRGEKGCPDTIPELELGKVSDVPRDNIILRFRSALKEKEEKISRYVQNGVIAQEDIKIIALSSSALGFWPMSGTIPFILSAVFPVGHANLSLDRETGEPVSFGYDFQPAVKKSNGAEVETLFFTDPAHNDISAVIYGSSHMGSFGKRGDDLFIIHNPLAKNPLPRKSLKLPIEYWADEGNGGVLNILRESLSPCGREGI